MSTVDKSSAGLGERQFHIGVAPGEVSSVALLPGDPVRVRLVAEFLSGVRTVAHRREHMTMVGDYKGRRITATSTGMGCSSTAIAAEELVRLGVTSLIRVGVARLRGVRAGMICACSSNLVDGASLYSGTGTALREGWMRSIEVALETAVRLQL